VSSFDGRGCSAVKSVVVSPDGAAGTGWTNPTLGPVNGTRWDFEAGATTGSFAIRV